MKLSFKFMKRIKTRIALSFSLLFLAVAIPAIIYAFNQVNLFFKGMYLDQMRVTGLTVHALFSEAHYPDYDSLTAAVSHITGSSVFLIASDGSIRSRCYEDGTIDTTVLLSIPILSNAGSTLEMTKSKFIEVNKLKYLQVQTELAGGDKLLQVKSFSRVTVLMARMREVIFWSSFLGLIALIAVAFWVSAKITRPLELLTAVAQKIRVGHLPEKSEIKSPDEVGELAEALNDIVDNLNQAKLRLGRLENMRRDFFGNVNERLEQPLTVISEALENLRRIGIGNEAAASSYLESALQQAQNLREVINKLIEISELEYGEVSLEIKPVALNSIMEAVTDKFRDMANRKGLEFIIDISPEMGEVQVECDKRLIRIALEHLIANAIEFTSSGQVSVNCQMQGDSLKITIEDTGEGIPQDQLGRICERFYQVGSPEVRDARGAGLGLSIVKHVVDAHDQKLEVESIYGVGSRFGFRLKLAESRQKES